MTKDELRKAMAALPEPVTDKKPPYWEYWRWELWHHVVDGDDPDEINKWPCVYHTMLQEHWPDVVNHEAREMGEVMEPANWYARAYIAQKYHLYKWEEASGKRIADMKRIFEFGGGFGAMAAVARDMGFRGSYVIYDIPEFQLLQQYWLEHWARKVPVQFAKKPHGIYDLAIACYSLSETPMILRREFENKLRAAHYLFLYSDRFESYNNVAYFNGFMARQEGLNWETWTKLHMPPTSIYSMGWSDDQTENMD